MRFAPLLLLPLLGCAGADCQAVNWYEIGFRDAIFGLQRQDDIYTRRCEGVGVDTARYVQGWVEGKYEADRRSVSAHD
jgi:hypothetical protein